MLQKTAKFAYDRRAGGNVCTGFGGIAGEIRHKIIMAD